jgi:hypothetical protein
MPKGHQVAQHSQQIPPTLALDRTVVQHTRMKSRTRPSTVLTITKRRMAVRLVVRVPTMLLNVVKEAIAAATLEQTLRQEQCLKLTRAAQQRDVLTAAQTSKRLARHSCRHHL